MRKRISIIVPVYNIASELPRCLNSILNQTYPDIEIIIVDDGSSDQSSSIIDEYASRHSNIKVFHKENGGVTSARLKGVQEATGEWIGFVDGDDEIESDMYERLLNNGLNHNAEISHCGYQLCFPDGRSHFFYNTGVLVENDKNSALQELLSGKMIEPSLCNKLFRKDLFNRFLSDRSIPKEIKINEDLLMNFYLFLEADKSVFEDWCPYHYIVRMTSASRTKMNQNKIYDPIWVKEIIRQTVDENLRSDAQRAYINTCINTYNILLTAGEEYCHERKHVLGLLKKEKNDFSILEKKRKLIASMIIGIPNIYKMIYNFYFRFLQKSVYS